MARALRWILAIALCVVLVLWARSGAAAGDGSPGVGGGHAGGEVYAVAGPGHDPGRGGRRHEGVRPARTAGSDGD